MAAPGRMAWAMASPVRLMRRSIRNTPTGAALSDSATPPSSAWRMKANSMKGPISRESLLIGWSPAWRAGGRRVDGDRDGAYEHEDAIRIMDSRHS
mgnify:CR=1 FL=1